MRDTDILEIRLKKIFQFNTRYLRNLTRIFYFRGMHIHLPSTSIDHQKTIVFLHHVENVVSEYNHRLEVETFGLIVAHTLTIRLKLL